MKNNIIISTNTDLEPALKELNPTDIFTDKYHTTAFFQELEWDKFAETMVYGFLQSCRSPFYFSRVNATNLKLLEEWTYGKPIRYWRDYLDVHEVLEGYHF